jgi:hypothetical protein
MTWWRPVAHAIARRRRAETLAITWHSAWSAWKAMRTTWAGESRLILELIGRTGIAELLLLRIWRLWPTELVLILRLLVRRRLVLRNRARGLQA